VTSTGSVTIGGKAVNYQAVAGTLVVHGPGLGRYRLARASRRAEPDKDKEGLPPEASIFYTAYFKQAGGKPAVANRAVTPPGP
jgi:hypothetical protein